MDTSKVSFILLCTVCAVIAIESESFRETKPGMLMRQKKKVVALKKPLRYHERAHGRQGNFQRGTSSSPDEYSVVYTSENPNGNWKPIPYALVEDSPQTAKSKPTSVNAMPNGKVGHIERTKNAEIEQPSPPQIQHEPTADPFEEYALLHYYIPFDQLVNQNSKPIAEVLTDTPQKPLTLEQIMTAAVEPVAMFQLETTSTTSTTTAAPTTTTTTTTTTTPPPPPPPMTTTDRTVRESDPSQSKDEEFAGRYEYEYFVQDNRWGTNFGHKEFRDGKQTKGDYEVVLPDGRVQHVQYWSDATGYHASVTYHPLYRKYKQ